MSSQDFHFGRQDRAELWQEIAKHIEARPQDLGIALDNLDRWETLGRVHPAPLREWRQRILAARNSTAGMQELLTYMRAPNHDSEPLKSCSPFVGLTNHTVGHS